MAKKEKEPAFLVSPINTNMPNYRVFDMPVWQKILFGIVIFVLGGGIGYVFYGGLFQKDGEPTTATTVSNVIVFILVGIVAVFIFLPAVRDMLRGRRDKALQIQFKDMLQSLAASLSSGSTITDAFQNAYVDMQNQYGTSDYIIIELKEIVDGLKNGQTLESMLEFFGNRTDNEDINNFSNVIANCFRMGSDFRVAVCTTRDIIIDKNSIEDEIETKLSSNKVQLNVMTIMPVGLTMMLKATNRDLADSLATPVGVIVTTVALAMFIGAYFWGQKIIKM